jgi:fucose 4-O-acetylase-like acetyltransferase
VTTPLTSDATASQTEVRPRLQSIDAARGIAIALVVLTHAAIVSWGEPQAEQQLWYQVTVAVNMPLFIFVAGYLLYRPDPRPMGWLVTSRARTLLIPYATWTVVNCAVDALTSPSAALQRLALGVVDPQAGGPWFLYVLFECVVLFAALAAVSRRSWWLIASTLAIALVLTVLPPRESTLLGKSYIQFLLPFMAFGFVFARHRKAWRVSDRVLAAGGLGLFAALCAIMLVPSTYAGWSGAMTQAGLPSIVVETSSRVLRYALGLSGVVGLFALAHLLRGWLAGLFGVLGVTSLGIYLFHLAFLQLLLQVPWMPLLVMTPAALALSVIVVLVIERWRPARFLLLGTRSRRFTDGGPWGARSSSG